MRYLALAADYDGTLASSGRLNKKVEGAAATAEVVRTASGVAHRQNVRSVVLGLPGPGAVRLRRAGERLRAVLPLEA